MNDIDYCMEVINRSANFTMQLIDSNLDDSRKVLIEANNSGDINIGRLSLFYVFRIDDFSMSVLCRKARENLTKSHFSDSQIEARKLLLEEFSKYDREHKLECLLGEDGE